MHRIQRFTPLAAVLWLGALCTAAVAQMPTGVDVLRAYQGTWNVAIDHLDTAQSKASHETSSLRNDCWKSGGYFACNQYVNGDSKILLVFTYDEKAHEYTSYQVPLGGGDAGSGKLRIEGNVWTFPWQVKDGDKVTYFHVVNVMTAPGKIEFRQEFSGDNTHWTLMARGSEQRTSDQ